MSPCLSDNQITWKSPKFQTLSIQPSPKWFSPAKNLRDRFSKNKISRIGSHLVCNRFLTLKKTFNTFSLKEISKRWTNFWSSWGKLDLIPISWKKKFRELRRSVIWILRNWLKNWMRSLKEGLGLTRILKTCRVRGEMGALVKSEVSLRTLSRQGKGTRKRSKKDKYHANVSITTQEMILFNPA